MNAKRVHAVDGMVGDFAGVEVMTVAVRPVHFVAVALPAGGLIGGEGYAGGLAHGAAATKEHNAAVVRAGQCFAVHGGGCFNFWFHLGIFHGLV